MFDFPIIIINWAQLNSYIFIGIGIGLSLGGLAGFLIGRNTKRLPLSVRKDLMKIEAVQKKNHGLVMEILELKKKLQEKKDAIVRKETFINEAQSWLIKANGEEAD
jgi:hypothetical protein